MDKMQKGLDQNFIHKVMLNLTSIDVAVQVCIGIFIILACVTAVKVFNINIWEVIISIGNKVGNIIGRILKGREERFNRSREIGRFSEKTRRVKSYRFLNDLIIDLGLKKRGATPYSFLFVVCVFTVFITTLGCKILFNSLVLAVFLMPIMFSFILCVCYTKANIEHDTRIEAVINTENIISNSISDGTVVAVRDNLHLMSPIIRGVYADFVDNVQDRNFHIKDALEELQNNLGSISYDFIRKCIVFELEEEHGIVGMFQDIVEINNIKMRLRTNMKRKFEEVVTEFIISATMISLFLFGILAFYPFVAKFYFGTLVGQCILAIDLLLFVSEFVYITYLRAKEL